MLTQKMRKELSQLGVTLKKINLFVIIAVLFNLMNIYANDTYVEVSSGTMSPQDLVKNSDIQMVSEHIIISLFDDYYETEVNFQFHNHGNSQTINVGFPQWMSGTQNSSEFLHFETFLNGEPITFEEVILDNPIELDNYIYINKWFLREINFPGNANTVTSVKYRVPYGTYGRAADYLFGTGSTWKDQIEEIKISIINNSQKWINEIHVGEYGQSEPFQSINGVVQTVLTNVRPELANTIFIETYNVPNGLVSMRRINPDQYWYYSENYISQNELAYLTNNQLRILRNLLFARHGHIFASQDLNVWFQTYCKDWYTPDHKVELNEFSEIEKDNLDRIITEENSRK